MSLVDTVAFACLIGVSVLLGWLIVLNINEENSRSSLDYAQREWSKSCSIASKPWYYAQTLSASLRLLKRS